MKKLFYLMFISFFSYGQDLCDGVTVELNSVTDSTINIVISTVNSPGFWCSYCGLVLRDNNDNIVAIENPYNGGSFYGLGGGYSELRTLDIINNIDLPFDGELHAVNGLMPNVLVDENFQVDPLNPIDMEDGDIPFTMCSWMFALNAPLSVENAGAETGLAKRLKEVMVVDFLGRETTQKGIQLYIYEDGSIGKKYVIK